MKNDLLIANKFDKDLEVFHARFWRCQRLLHFIACRVLGSPERADETVENCWFTAVRNPPHFESEGEFRSWLLRVVIDEALAILYENRQKAQVGIGLRRHLGGPPNQLNERRSCC
jgi:DNA-directed RNA polymerase specialized sigma24 family protein